MILSILTPALVERRKQFRALKDKIQKQIQDGSFEDRVEHLSLEDNREQSTGYKRNRLLEKARGDFVVFVDDDDDVSENYVSMVCDAIESNPGIDCIGIQGVITFNGSHPHPFIHSLKYDRYFKKEGVYYRPILHINPIKRGFANQYTFANVSYSEDMDWGFRIMKGKVLKAETLIETPLYFYHSRRRWWYQWIIDKTEKIRQLLGLQFVNRIRFLGYLKHKK